MAHSTNRGAHRAKVLAAFLALAGAVSTASFAQAAPAFAPLDETVPAAVTPVQYWGDHGGWGHRRHHDGYGFGGGYGPRRHHHHGWGHRDRHDWGHGGGHRWGHHHHREHHHHHRGHGGYSGDGYERF